MRDVTTIQEPPLDPLLALAALACAAGLLVLVMFHGPLGGLRQFGAAPLYLVAMPASLLLGRWLQLCGAPRRARRCVPQAARTALRRPARRVRTLPTRRRLRGLLAAVIAAPLPR